MAQCVKCGKKGIFLSVNSEGICEVCDLARAAALEGVRIFPGDYDLTVRDHKTVYEIVRYEVEKGTLVKPRQPVCVMKYAGGRENIPLTLESKSHGNIHFLVPLGSRVVYDQAVAVVTAPEPLILGVLDGFWGIPWGTSENAVDEILRKKDNISPSDILPSVYSDFLLISRGDFAGFTFSQIRLYSHEDKFYSAVVEYKYQSEEYVRYDETAVSLERLNDKIKVKYGDGQDMSDWTSSKQIDRYQWDFENGRIELKETYSGGSVIQLIYTEKNIEGMKQKWEQAQAAKEKAGLEARGNTDI